MISTVQMEVKHKSPGRYIFDVFLRIYMKNMSKNPRIQSASGFTAQRSTMPNSFISRKKQD